MQEPTQAHTQWHIGTQSSDQRRVCFPQTAPAPQSPSLAGWVAGALRVAQSSAWGAEMGVCWGEGCQGGAEQRPRGREPRSPNPRRKPNVFSRSSEDIWNNEVGRGKLDYKKGFLISKKKKKKKSRVFKFDFCFSGGCLCNFPKRDPVACS